MTSTVTHPSDEGTHPEAPHNSLSTNPPTPASSTHDSPADPDVDVARGRLKRRRLSSHSPPRASSPSRGHDRDSGSRHRHHYRKHQRASSSPLISPPPQAKKNRRRSDAEPDHTFRGRVRNRSESRSESAILEGEEGLKEGREVRKRSQPPSRGRGGEGEPVDGENVVRRLRSYPNLYQQGSNHVRENEKSSGAVAVDDV